MHSPLPRPLAVGLLLLSATACRDDPTGTDAPARAADRPSAAESPLRETMRPSEASFRHLASRVAGFAGYYYGGDGELVVRTTDPGRGAMLRAAVASAAAEGTVLEALRGSSAPRVVVDRAEYSFAELSGWRDRAESAVFALAGVALVDLDERENRVVVGVAEERFRGAVVAGLKRAGIPPSAIRVEVVGAVEGQRASGAGAAASGCANLLQACRPLIGGIQITFARDGGEPANGCTLGFGALWASEARFVTASHCSDDEWNPDGTLYHQPFATNPVGMEWRDPNGSACELVYRCRYSDATLVAPSTPVDVGYIARPYSGSVQVNPSASRFTIAGYRDAAAGETVYMVGRTSGLIHGRVTRTCASVKKTWEGRWHKVVCTDISDYDSQAGDSGGPVFLWDGASSLVTLVGLHFGRNPLYDHAYFSPMSGIRHTDDLGRIEVRAPQYRTSSGGGGGAGGCGDCPFPE